MTEFSFSVAGAALPHRPVGGRSRPVRALGTLAALVLLCLAQPALSRADHVSANPQVSAHGEPLSSQSWTVVVDWSVNCSASDGNYYGSLNLVDAATGEKIYMGGISQPSGTDRQPVQRYGVVRRMYPLISASCSSAPPESHGSDFREAAGNTVLIPALGGDRERRSGSDRDAGAQGRRDFPGARFGGPRSPLRDAGCGTERVGTNDDDTLNGTRGADRVFGLAGNDLLRGRGDDDCLIGGRGRDRLLGAGGWDRLTGGSGPDDLVGGGGRNRYDAGAGNDVVRAANGVAELVSCGSGRRDRARVDRTDRVRSCEIVKRGG